MNFRTSLLATGAATLLFTALPAEMAQAQSSAVARIDKLEKEMRAVQRKVFPGGDPRYFEPEIAPGQPVAGTNTPNSSTGITPEMLARIDSLESALQRLTGRIEEQELALGDMQKRLSALDGGGMSVPTPVPATAKAVPASPAKPVAASASASTSPDPSRVAAVAAIEKPSTDDAGEDAYSYGYRLWNAGFYPEARIALEDFIKKYPKHARISHARNLLGRAWLDDGKPASSVEIFLGNYQTDPKGARAPDSLLFLSLAMVQLDKSPKACVVLEELTEVYPDVASGRLANDIAVSREQAKCK